MAAAPTLLLVLVAPEWLWTVLNSPRETPAELQARFDAQAQRLQHMENTGGDLMTAASRIRKDERWHTLKAALQDPRAYPAFLATTRADLEAALSQLVVSYLGDRYIDIGEQLDITAWGFANGLLNPEERSRVGYVPPFIRSVIERTVQDANRSGEQRYAIISPDPIAPGIVWFDDAIQAVTSSSAAITTLKTAIETNTIRPWLGSQKVYLLRDQLIEHYQRDQHKVDRANWQLAWALTWTAGVPWLDLDWTPATRRVDRPRRIDTPAQWLEAIGKHGPATSLNPVTHHILSVWLEIHGAPETAIRAADDAQASTHPASTQTAIWKAAWRLGLTHLNLSNGTRLDSLEDLLKLAPDNPGLLDAVRTTLPAWLAEVYDINVPPRLPIEVQATLAANATLAVQLLQWMAGAVGFAYKALTIPTPDATTILKATATSTEHFQLLGAALIDRSIQAWLTARPPGDANLAGFTSLASSANSTLTTTWCAQLARLHLKDPRLDLSLASGRRSDGQTVFKNVGDLASNIHTCWGIAATEPGIHAVHAWLTYHLELKKLPTHQSTEGELQRILWTAGDKTLRDLDGLPFGLKQGRRFGHEQTPQEALTDVVAWYDSSHEGRSALASFLQTDALHRWLRRFLPDKANEVERFTTGIDAGSYVQAVASRLGSTQLRLSDQLTVTSVPQLIAAARDHLDAIEALLDNGLLAAWSGNDFASLSDRLTWATEVLDTRASSFDDARARLVLVNRAALAVVALGGRPDVVTGLAPELKNFPPNKTIVLKGAVRVNRADVPIQHLVISDRGSILGLIETARASDDGSMSVGLVLGAAARTFTLWWSVLNPVDANADRIWQTDLRSASTVIPVRFDHAGVLRALKMAMVPTYALGQRKKPATAGFHPIADLADTLSPMGCAIVASLTASLALGLFEFSAIDSTMSMNDAPWCCLGVPLFALVISTSVAVANSPANKASYGQTMGLVIMVAAYAIMAIYYTAIKLIITTIKLPNLITETETNYLIDPYSTAQLSALTISLSLIISITSEFIRNRK